MVQGDFRVVLVDHDLLNFESILPYFGQVDGFKSSK